MDWNGFRGAAKRIDDLDLPRLGYILGVGEDEIHAFIDAETSGSGFDKNGRPKMLFEPHVFYRHLSGAKRDRAVKEGLARKTWKVNGKVPKYPSDSYPRLIAAMAIDETAALKAASWGLGQVLGENHVAAGFDTPQEMVRAMMEDEDAHLRASVMFIKNNNLDDELRAHQWAAFARGYNGPGYKANRYDEKLAKAYARWARIRDTPWSPADDEKPVTKPVEKKLPEIVLPSPEKVIIAPAPSVPERPKPELNWWQRILHVMFGMEFKGEVA